MNQQQVRKQGEDEKARTDVETTAEPAPTLALPAPDISRLAINVLNPTFEQAGEDSRKMELLKVRRGQTPAVKSTRWIGPMLSGGTPQFLTPTPGEIGHGGTIMKMMFGMLVGAILGAVLLAGPLSPILTSAQSGDAGLLPDIEKIYREALVSPLEEVGREIEDEEIAGFYYTLMQRTGLDTWGQGESSQGGSNMVSALQR